MEASELKSKINSIVENVKKQSLKVLAIEGEKSIAKNFEVGGRPSWKARKRISKKQRGRKLLVISGAMKNVRARVLSDRVQLVTDARARAYAKIQNEGGLINMPAREMKFRKGKSGKTVFASNEHKRISKTTSGKAYTIKIPARRYMVIPEEDFQRILEQLKSGIKIW